MSNFATDEQRQAARAALRNLSARGMSRNAVSKAIGKNNSNLYYFEQGANTIGATGCLAIVRLDAESSVTAAPVPQPSPSPSPKPITEPVVVEVDVVLTDAQCAAIDAQIAAFRAALPGVSISRHVVVRGLVEAALAKIG